MIQSKLPKSMVSCVLSEAGVAIRTLGLCIEDPDLDLKQDQTKSRSVSATFTISWQMTILHFTSRSARILNELPFMDSGYRRTSTGGISLSASGWPKHAQATESTRSPNHLFPLEVFFRPCISITSRLLSVNIPPLNLPTLGAPIPLCLLLSIVSFLPLVTFSRMTPFSLASFLRLSSLPEALAAIPFLWDIGMFRWW